MPGSKFVLYLTFAAVDVQKPYDLVGCAQLCFLQSFFGVQWLYLHDCVTQTLKAKVLFPEMQKWVMKGLNPFKATATFIYYVNSKRG